MIIYFMYLKKMQEEGFFFNVIRNLFSHGELTCIIIGQTYWCSQFLTLSGLSAK